MARGLVRGLATLARMCGVQSAFYDVEGRRRRASSEALFLVLRALGMPVENWADIPDALRQRRLEMWERSVEPVVVAWDGQTAGVDIRLPAALADDILGCRLALESGDVHSWSADAGGLPAVDGAAVEGKCYVAKRLPLPLPLPWGYHRLALEWAGRRFETTVISAPARAYVEARRCWGVFLPLYALHSQGSWGAGDLTDLGSLLDWVAGLGGDVVATLPLLPAFLDRPLEPSPYVPLSRLFWNESFIDVTRVPELQRCPAAQAIMESPGFRQELESLRSLPLVEYGRQMGLKRRVLEELARCFFAERSERHAAFERFVEAQPLAEDYARFRALVERRSTPWRAWPQRLQDGALAGGDYDEAAKQYHLYVQWIAQEQMRALSRKARAAGVRLYMDLPLGVHPDGFDVWRQRHLFAQETSVGAPPDVFFTRGQDWGFPPPHPEAMRQQGYRYLIACLRHHLEHAGILRIDHVMGLHRLYWVPRGLEARQGVYVRYPAQELYAILSVESHRHRALIAGEDLGTVPRYVRSEMARRGIQRTYAVQFEVTPDPGHVFRPVPAASVASLNSHDMPPFAAFWRGVDIDDRFQRGLVDQEGSSRERESREGLKAALRAYLERQGLLKEHGPDQQGVLWACLALLGAGPARVVLVSLEDLWLETVPQNIPGTTMEERPNWRRRARYSLEEFGQRPEIVDILREVNRLRK